MIDSFRNIFAIPDLRKRVFFTFALLAVYRLGAFIPIPGIDPVAIAEFTKAAEGTVLGFLNLFSGGALGRMTVFALGIMPYISALDHPAAADGGVALSREALQRG